MLDKEKKDKILDEFRVKIISEGAPKKLTWDCWCCGNIFESYRRDLTYAMVSFLVVLYKMEKETGKHYHKFRDVMAECEKRYNVTPSDYSYLHNQWNCLEKPDFMSKRENLRHFGLNQKGMDYLNNKVRLQKFFYIEPITRTALFSQSTKSFADVCNAEMEEKKPRKPFNNLDDD